MTDGEASEFFVTVTLPGTPEHFVRGFRDRVTVGRENAGLLLAHPEVSRRHAELSLLPDGRFRVTDLGSTNGTVVNDEALERGGARTVAGEALVLVGPYVLRLTSAEGTFDATLKRPPARAGGRLELDYDLRVLKIDGEVAIEAISGLEFKLLDVLLSAGRRLVAHQAIGDSVWGAGMWDIYMLHNLVRRVRRKLEAAGLPADELIVSVPGGGYRAV